MVKLHYLRSNFIGHSTHTDLYWEFGSLLKEFNGNKLLQISMGGTNINLKLLNDIAKDCVAN